MEVWDLIALVAEAKANGSDSVAGLERRLKSGELEDADLHLGFYLDEDGYLCQST